MSPIGKKNSFAKSSTNSYIIERWLIYLFHRFFEPNVISLKFLVLSYRVTLKTQNAGHFKKHQIFFKFFVISALTKVKHYAFHCISCTFHILTHPAKL